MKKVLLFILTCFYQAILAQVPTSGLIGAWTFSGNANDVVGTNHGTVTAATLTTDRCGNANSAYSFNGSSSYIVTNGLGPIGSASRSLSFWARTTNTTINNPKVAFDYGLNGGSGDTWQVVWNYCGLGVGLDMSNQAIIKGNSCLTDGRWHHIVIVFNSTVSTVYSTSQFYFDGVLQSAAIPCNVSGTSAVVNTGTTFPITIGRGVTPVRYFLGDLDDFYLYNRPLTAAEVLQLYTPCVSPVAGTTLMCPGSSAVYSVPAIPGAVYSWTLPSGWMGSSTTNSILVTSSTNTGVISVAYTSGCGNSISPSTITVQIAPISVAVTPSNVVLCGGQNATLTASGAGSYTWMPGNVYTNTLLVQPGQPTVYTVTGSNGPGCSTTQTVSVGFGAVTLTVESKLICKGSAAFLTASGGSTYTWQPGNLSGPTVTVVPTNNTNYTVITTPPNCNNTVSAVVSITLSSCTGVGQNELANEIALFPNPAKDYLMVKIKQQASASLLDNNGVALKTLVLETGENKIDLGSLAPAVYYLEVFLDKTSQIYRVVKQ